MIKNKLLKRSLWVLLTVFLLMNAVAAFHAYKFTHFSSSNQTKTKSARQLSVFDKIKVVFTGINNPRPANKKLPELPYRTLVLKSNKLIECWEIKSPENKGTVAIFHGYSGCKATMLDKAYEFLKLGYNVLLVDFMGAGGSEGNQCSIGYHEAEQVKTVNDYLTTHHQKQIILFGTSMGAAAILRAVSQYSLQANALILECPFGSMLQTVGARFKTMHVPSFPMANLLVFWGGVENSFNAFRHNPTDYARDIHCPTLLMYGLKDEEVSNEETTTIFNNLKGPKSLKTFALAAHENYLKKYSKEWIISVSGFLTVVK